jgi:hypothetical protein
VDDGLRRDQALGSLLAEISKRGVHRVAFSSDVGMSK